MELIHNIVKYLGHYRTIFTRKIMFEQGNNNIHMDRSNQISFIGVHYLNFVTVV